MQATPVRLSQVIRTVFQASRPVTKLRRPPFTSPDRARPSFPPCRAPGIAARIDGRRYSDGKRGLEGQVEEAKTRIGDAISARADPIKQDGPGLAQDLGQETMIHTTPEASSIVHSRTASSPPDKASDAPPSDPADHDSSLPSSTSSRRSALSKRFSHLMDNLQANLFTASRRINDLTGYSGIENLKNNISQQEDLVLSLRRAVKELRAKYAAAVSGRATTQREVNDLLHRKHAWTPADLERFTALYRSDHANELAEAAAQQELSQAESSYEEASTKLARTILARYHEEQIWSDKIRQMSTWGTWGLMGLNVLLFILFQIAVEPWRRKRLVKGFEEKVQAALEEARSKANVQVVVPQSEAGDMAEGLASALVDAVSGSHVPPTPAPPPLASPSPPPLASPSPPPLASPSPPPLASPSPPPLASPSPIETAVETVTDAEAAQDLSFPKPSDNASRWSTPGSSFASYEDGFRELFSEREIVLTQRDLTTAVMEGAAGGAAVMGILLVLLRPR